MSLFLSFEWAQWRQQAPQPPCYYAQRKHNNSAITVPVSAFCAASMKFQGYVYYYYCGVAFGKHYVFVVRLQTDVAVAETKATLLLRTKKAYGQRYHYPGLWILCSNNEVLRLGIKKSSFGLSAQHCYTARKANIIDMASTIDTRVKHRIGFPVLPVLPVVTRPVSGLDKRFPNWHTHLSQILIILDQHSIGQDRTDVCYRLHSESEPHDRYITVMTLAPYTNDSETTWPNAVRGIRQYLDQVEIHLAIEIIATPLWRGLKSFPVISDPYQWNDVLLPSICALLEGRQWISLDMIYREDVEKSSIRRPTIVIGARDADDQIWWDHTIPAVKQRVAQFEMQVELVHRCKILTAGPASLLFHLGRSFDSNNIPIGSSCGSSGGRTGTLGGKMGIKNRDTGAQLTCGISNHHVLSHQLNGEGPFTTFEDPIPVESPSNADRELYISNLKSLVDMDSPGASIRLNATKLEGGRIMDRQTANLKEAEGFDSHAGEVFASSGFRSAQTQSQRPDLSVNWALDWCLTTVKERSFKNKFQSAEPFGWKQIAGYCSIDPYQAYRVMKTGRTSGFTVGFISATQSAIRHEKPELPEPGLTVKSTKIIGFSDPVRCHSMVGEQDSHVGKEFIQAGDSGSLILLDPHDYFLPQEKEKRTGFNGLPDTSDSSEWESPWNLRSLDAGLEREKSGDDHDVLIAGLAFGGSEYSLVSYMMPFDLVVRDIESVTRWDVVEPAFAGAIKRS